MSLYNLYRWSVYIIMIGMLLFLAGRYHSLPGVCMVAGGWILGWILAQEVYNAPQSDENDEREEEV